MFLRFIPLIGIIIVVITAIVEEIPTSDDINTELSPELVVEVSFK